ncbi:MAG: LLM class flavin-dependent oxidoreductase [Candidatus Bathyarchaeia archaeon]|jgi:alkanesulfonate monooxygenase SsuD/methylene tetrahydromethanopterin reductase-like flavin-dependent oxidoreductase (luciferase family)
MREPKFGFWINSPLKEGGPFDAIQQGVLAERNGFDSVWLGDHFMMWAGEFCETFTALTAIGMKTKRVILSSAVTDPLRRHPAVIAQIVASIDRLTHGRASLGIGSGEALNLIPFGIKWEKPFTTLIEAVQVIKALWKSSLENPACYDGNVFHLKDAYIKIKPVQIPHPPIFVGALRKKTRELVGQLADGYFPWINSPETYPLRLKEIESGAKKVGRTLDDIEKVVVLPLSISKDPNKAREAIQQYSRSALILEKEVLQHYGCHIPETENILMQSSLFTKGEMQVIEKSMKIVPEVIVDEISAFGTEEDCINKIDKFFKAGADHIVVLNYSTNFNFSMKAFHNEIIPYFKEQYQ